MRNTSPVTSPGMASHAGEQQGQRLWGGKTHLLEQQKDSVAGVESARGKAEGDEVSKLGRVRWGRSAITCSELLWSPISQHPIGLLFAPGVCAPKFLPERVCLKLLRLNKLMFVLHRDFWIQKQLKYSQTCQIIKFLAFHSYLLHLQIKDPANNISNNYPR